MKKKIAIAMEKIKMLGQYQTNNLYRTGILCPGSDRKYPVYFPGVETSLFPEIKIPAEKRIFPGSKMPELTMFPTVEWNQERLPEYYQL